MAASTECCSSPPPAADAGATGPPRRGTILARDLDRAHAEARAITLDGGTAEIIYIDPHG